MSKYVERAKELRASTEKHYSCAAAVFIPFAEEKGFDTETARMISQNFGGGARSGSNCGGTFGGIMAIGLYGLIEPADAMEFYKRFRERHDNLLTCPQLLKASAERGEEKKAHCDGLVYECVGIVEEILKEHNLL